MRIVQPSATLESITPDALKLVERCGRTAYKSEDKITDDSAPAFVAMLIKRGHESVLEHASATIRFVCDRGVSHELVRHRLCAFTQESTRYCDYGDGGGIAVVEPHNDQGIPLWPSSSDMSRDTGGLGRRDRWSTGIAEACDTYRKLRAVDVAPQHARAVLPTCLKTEIVCTANLREWRHIFCLRLAPAAHPMMRYVMRLALAELVGAVPVVFDEFWKADTQDWHSGALRAAQADVLHVRPDLAACT